MDLRIFNNEPFNLRIWNAVTCCSNGDFGQIRISFAKLKGEIKMVFYAFYVIAIIVLILHFTGWLKRNNLEWLILALAVSVFPVVIFLR
jgi:hypothetical protein